MGKFRKIDPRIHNDATFRSLNLAGRYLFMFVLTHPAMTMIGAMRATKEGIVSELKGLDKGLAEGFSEEFDKAVAKGLLWYEESACLLFVPNFIKYNLPENPNVVKSWNVVIDSLPECEMRDLAFARCVEILQENQSKFVNYVPKEFAEAYAKGLAKPLSKGLAKSMPIQEHRTYIYINKEKEDKEKEKNSGFSQISCADSLSISPEEIESINHDLNYLTKTETENDIPVFGVPSTTEESEKQKKPKAKKEKTSLCGVRKPEGLDDKTWSDYLKIRKGKLSDRGMHDIEIQASKAGLTIAQAIEFSVRKGWIGFNANWYNRALSSENCPGDESVSEKAKRIAQAISGGN